MAPPPFLFNGLLLTTLEHEVYGIHGDNRLSGHV
jgi:hypothetical protein